MSKQSEINQSITKLQEELVIAKKALSEASCKYKKINSTLAKHYKDLFLLGPEVITPPTNTGKK